MAENELKKDNSRTVQIKSEYVILNHVREINMKFVTSNDKNNQNNQPVDGEKSEPCGPPKKKLKGQNKRRPRGKKIPRSEKLCFNIVRNGECSFGDSCCYTHDISAYLLKKPENISDICYLFETFGYCPYGFTCCFSSNHVRDGKNCINDALWSKFKDKQLTKNILTKELQKCLRKRDYNFKISEEAVKLFQIKCQKSKDKVVSQVTNDSPSENITDKQPSQNECSTLLHDQEKPENSKIDNNSVHSINKDKDGNQGIKCDNLSKPVDVEPDEKSFEKEISFVGPKSECSQNSKTLNISGVVTDEDIIRIRASEIKKVDFTNKLYLAPLTTVGNLPFRRICKEFGADITCGEMAMATNLLQGQQSEWALLKRHHTEDIFGVQLCGAHPDILTRCSQVLIENISVDFIDLNMGCPIELVYKQGAGSELMHRLKKLEGIIYGVTSVINVPLTLKMRTGVYGNQSAHTVIKKIHEWGDQVGLITMHGRSREQRYTKSADWNYIKYCNELAHPIPFFGNGDVLSYEDYNKHLKESGVSGIMIARAALLKPWIFKEIKEQIHWDISSSERFEILKTYVNYGLEHWGSDAEGVEKTRRFLLEWLSFLYRYIPVGLLERVPQKINERPPPYVGRNDLETLMASPSCADWIKISEMLLGPVPDNFTFLPKHKANAYQ